MGTIKKTPWTFWTHSLIIAALSAALFLALFSYDINDPGFSTFNQKWGAPQNHLGYLGSWTADILFQLLGLGAWIVPSFGLLMIPVHFKKKNPELISWKSFMSLCGLLICTGLLLRSALGSTPEPRDFLREGLVGYGLYSFLRPLLGEAGIWIVSLLGLWFSALLHFEEWLTQIIFQLLNKGSSLLLWAKNTGKNFSQFSLSKLKGMTGFLEKKPKAPTINDKTPAWAKEGIKIEEEVAPEKTIRVSQPVELPKQKPSPVPKATSSKNKSTSWELPPLSLLTASKVFKNRPSKSELMRTSEKIISTLKSFEIEGEITEITPGPILTVYEYQPSPGIRAHKIVSCSTDLAMALGAPSIRIVAPIPGKSVIGIEVPNSEREEITLRDLIEITAQNSKQRLPVCLGKDTEGKPVIEDLSRMPHLLIGGATNMGKSVLVNSILTGLLCKFTPDDLRFIIVDPKLVEFKIYEDIPHLLLPIVNDPLDASKALKWAVNETKRRYLKMQEVAAKNLDSYNEKSKEDEKLESFPFIVIIIDELAELMLTAKKDVEQSIVRLTQLARAAGIHLIMATQRPSADVVTGLIKSNCPSRAALRVASSSDSRIILDSTGAELLLGKGDMFFTNSGPMGLRRLQGSFVSDSDVEKISDFWRNQGSPEYQNEILAEEDDGLLGDASEKDSLYPEVIAYAKEKGAISTSLIQRRFQIGYTRAARIMEQLEAAGVVAEQSSAGKARDVLI